MAATWVSYDTASRELRTVPSELKRLNLSVNLISFRDEIGVGSQVDATTIVADAEFNPAVQGVEPPDDQEIFCTASCWGEVEFINGHIVYSQLQEQPAVLIRLKAPR